MRIYLFFTILLSVNVFAEDFARFEYGGHFYQQCEKTALQTRMGYVIKVEFKLEDDQPVYEFNIRATDGRDWDIECDAATNQIIEIEEEVPSVAHPLFAKQKHISETQARAIALAAWPGDIIEIEYEIEVNGAATYEFDIDTYQGKEMKIEVDASSGNISEHDEELWQEGYE